MSRRCTIAGALLVLAASSRCDCGQNAAGDPCEDSAQCPTGFTCHPDLQQCVRSDAGVVVRDAASDANTLAESGQLDAAASDAQAADDHPVAHDAAAADTTLVPTDAVLPDQGSIDAAGVERGPDLDGGTGEAGVGEAGPVDAALPIDVPLPDLTPPVDAARPSITVTVTPRDGATSVAVGTTVQLDFSRPMSSQSVEGGGLCLAALTGPCVAGNFAWLNAASVVFTPLVALDASAVHVVTVRNACTDQDGYPFVGAGGLDCSAPDQCTRFTTSDGTPPTVMSVVPAPGATNIALQPTVTLTFSEAMDQASVVAHVRVGSGEVSGSWSWTSAVVYRFVPSVAFGCSTSVQVSVDQGARDPSGLALVDSCASVAGVAFCSSFTTRPAHQECHDVQTGTCSDVLTLMESCCGGCAGSVAVSCVNVGTTYTVSCGSSCTTGCHYRREYDTQRVCSNVCS
ncbi:MAG: Ig-like domain-containing protein [Pseudomonadota bacterium]